MTLPHVGLCGHARAGKDTAAAQLADLGYHRIAFADEVRAFALDVDPLVGPGVRLSDTVRAGWEAAKTDPEVRRLLQRLGTEGVRARDPEFWVRAAMAHASQVNGPVVFTDVRFANEAAAVRRLGGIVVRIDRHDAGAGANAEHASECIDFNADAVIANDGTINDLRAAMRSLVLSLVLG